MPPWNDGHLRTISYLRAKNQAYYFYDGAPRDSLPPELQDLDREVDAFAVRLQQQIEWVYPTVGYNVWSRSPMFERFERRTLRLARPLLERRRQCCEKMNASDRLCALLPSELVSRIFEFAVERVQVDDSIPSLPKLSDTLQLASVTRLWRSLVLANPNLWASFRLLPSETDEANWDCLDAVEYFLQRSGNVGLHVHLKVGYDWGDSYSRLVAIVRHEAPRIRTLHIDVPLYTPAEFLASLNFPFPNANVVVIDSDDSLKPNLITPCVSHVRLRMQLFEGFRPWLSTLVFLELTGICLYEPRVLMQTAGALKTLKVHVVLGQPPNILTVNSQGCLELFSAHAMLSNSGINR